LVTKRRSPQLSLSLLLVVLARDHEWSRSAAEPDALADP
jgi:hypothetical protein